MKKLLFALFFVLAFGVSTVFAASNVTFEWDANTESDLAGYRLYQFGVSVSTFDTDNNEIITYDELIAAPGTLADSIIAEIPAGTETVIVQIVDGTGYYIVTAYDTEETESNASNEVMVVIEPPPPMPTPPAAPTGLRRTVTIIININ